MTDTLPAAPLPKTLLSKTRDPGVYVVSSCLSHGLLEANPEVMFCQLPSPTNSKEAFPFFLLKRVIGTMKIQKGEKQMCQKRGRDKFLRDNQI